MLTRIVSTPALPEDIGVLVDSAEQEGFRFLRRLIDEWSSGVNRFDRPGEALFIARDGDNLSGVCGVNVDPYVRFGETARFRHLYVDPRYRRAGVGRALVAAAVEFARESGYHGIRLRTDTPSAAMFYEACGFVPALGSQREVTHMLRVFTADDACRTFL